MADKIDSKNDITRRKSTENFLAQDSDKVMVPEYAPLLCLAFYLHLNFENQSDRVQKTNILFYKAHDTQFRAELLEALESDKPSYDCYLQAKNALGSRKIEAYKGDDDPLEIIVDDKSDDERAYSVSFLTWAESAGFKIPKYVIDDMAFASLTYYSGKNRRDKIERLFPKITIDEFFVLAKEPLWPISKAVIHILGRDVKTTGEGVTELLESSKTAQKLILYAQDANSAGVLDFIGNPDEHVRTTWLFRTKVKPHEFTEWGKTLPMQFPLICTPSSEPIKEDKPLSSRERTVFLNIIGALLGVLLGKSSNGKPYSQFESQQSIIDAIHANYGEQNGLSKRNLESKFAEARRNQDEL